MASPIPPSPHCTHPRTSSSTRRPRVVNAVSRKQAMSTVARGQVVSHQPKSQGQMLADEMTSGCPPVKPSYPSLKAGVQVRGALQHAWGLTGCVTPTVPVQCTSRHVTRLSWSEEGHGFPGSPVKGRGTCGNSLTVTHTLAWLSKGSQFTGVSVEVRVHVKTAGAVGMSAPLAYHTHPHPAEAGSCVHGHLPPTGAHGGGPAQPSFSRSSGMPNLCSLP